MAKKVQFFGAVHWWQVLKKLPPFRKNLGEISRKERMHVKNEGNCFYFFKGKNKQRSCLERSCFFLEKINRARCV